MTATMSVSSFAVLPLVVLLRPTIRSVADAKRNDPIHHFLGQAAVTIEKVVADEVVRCTLAGRRNGILRDPFLLLNSSITPPKVINLWRGHIAHTNSRRSHRGIRQAIGEQ